MKGRWGEEGTGGQCGERFRRPRTLPVSLCSHWRVGTVPGTLVLSGLRSRIEPAGPVSKAHQRWRRQQALLCGAVGRGCGWDPVHGVCKEGMGMFGAEMWGLDFNSLVSVNTSAVYQRPGNWGSWRKTRLMSTQGGGMAGLVPCETLSTV